jgi:predicted Ser/Thr protein kinase
VEPQYNTGNLMTLSSGTRLGPYEILVPLGAGGMGEVYRARDTKLGRDVALKVLVPSLANDTDYLWRFQREVQILAALNHPNIAHIYGVEQQAIVMELVEGRTLEGPVPLQEAIALVRQIAGALEAAHEKGIIHRDLKPGNVKITPDGSVKVLDFGLAKAAAPVSGDTSNSPTLTIRSTQVGAILGTAGYMAPEQARGYSADHRADIWAFGAVFYEMLTGKMAFAGDNVTDVLASVVKTEPDWSALPLSTPESVHTLLQRCLTKDRKQRLQAIGEARIVLEQPGSVTTPQPTRSFRMVAVAAFLIALGVAVVAWRATRPVSKALVQWTVQPGSEFFAGGGAAAAILSPDGTRIVYKGTDPDGKVVLYTRLLEQERALILAGTEGATDPFFSPDGEAVGFFAASCEKCTYEVEAPSVCVTHRCRKEEAGAKTVI